MALQEKQEQRTRDAVKKSWNENDIFGMLQAGFSNFMMILYEKSHVF